MFVGHRGGDTVADVYRVKLDSTKCSVKVEKRILGQGSVVRRRVRETGELVGKGPSIIKNVVKCPKEDS